jgi:two-component system sensor histidine kinase AlgZ
MKNMDTRKPAADSLFLPDFCSVGVVFVVVLIAELLAIVLNLAANAPEIRWDNLGLLSMLIQWIALVSVAVLCVIRRWLRGMSNIQAGLFSYILLIVITLLISEISYRFIGSYLSADYARSSYHADFLIRNTLISMIVCAVLLRYLYIQHQWKQHIQLESQARIQALQARIRPHFLFNSMNVIASLTRSDPNMAEQAVEDLADLFRFSMSDASKLIPLDQEIEIARRYLHIETLRLSERLQVDWQIGDYAHDVLVPALLIQPLIENAVYHGIEPCVDGGTIAIEITQRDGILEIQISNPLEVSDKLRSHEGNRIALENIRERLKSIYGARATMEIAATESQYRIKLRFPAQAPSI